MTDTKEILQKIAALRVRLDQGAGTSQPASSAALEEKTSVGARHHMLLDGTLRQAGGERGSEPMLPAKLTARGATVLKRGRELLGQLREMLDDPLLKSADNDPMTCLHAEIASMLDVLLRTIQAFPVSASAQLRMCDGLEVIERLARERLMVLHAGLTQRRRETDRLDRLTDDFRKLGAGQNINLQGLLALAEDIARDARSNQPLRFMHASAEDPARFVAAHSITVARVMARLLHADPEWKDRLDEALLATLLHDVGMVRLPAGILASPGPLTDEQRRLMERHPNVGAHIISRIMPGGGIFVEGATDHHERLDGTGYPAGRRDVQLSSFARVLAICDVYAALATPRPYRPAHETRTALADTLLLADQGALDRGHAEKLLGLSFHPVGSVVELSDGAAAYVIATQPGRLGIDNPGKPILSLLTGPGGEAVVVPRLVNLLEDPRTVVRALTRAERHERLLGRYPELIG